MKTLARALLCFVLLQAVTAGYCGEADDFLLVLNFQPLTPPTNLMVPGAVLAIEEELVNGKMQPRLQMVCGPRSSLSETAQLMQSNTISQTLNNKLKSSWSLDAAAMSAIGLNSEHRNVRSVTVSMTNAKILSLSDADVLAALPNRAEACSAAIRQRLANGYKITMISSALVADLVWTVDWDEQSTAKMTARDKIAEMQRIAASVGGGHSKIGQKKIESKQIALGIRTDAFLLALTVPEISTESSHIAEQARREKEGTKEPVHASVSSPDSPYVLPSGGTYLMPEISYDD